MDRCGLLSELFPEIETMRGVSQNRYHTEDVWGHSLLCLHHMESLINDPEPFFPSRTEFLKRHLAVSIGGGWDRASLLKFVSLFHDIGKPAVKSDTDRTDPTFYGHENVGVLLFKKMTKRILLGKKGVRFSTSLIRHHMRMLSLSVAEKITARALFRLIRDLGDDLPALLLLGAADTCAGHVDTRRLEKTKRLIDEVFTAYDDMKKSKTGTTPLIDGNEIMAVTGLDEGTHIGRIKAELMEAQALGEVKTKREARRFVKQRGVKE
jgi:poly(A) polymerase